MARRTRRPRNSFVAFAANYAGNPPAPFRAFEAGEAVFYLVGVASVDGGRPAPTAQLSVFTETVKGTGRDPVDTVREEAKAWQGRTRVVVATREYSWERYTKGAKALAREAAEWTAPDGSPLALWSYVVAVDDAEGMGYKVPKARTQARPGCRGVGLENKAGATVEGSKVVAAPKPDPVDGPDDDQLDALDGPADPAPVVDPAPAPAPKAWGEGLSGPALLAALLAD